MMTHGQTIDFLKDTGMSYEDMVRTEYQMWDLDLTIARRVSVRYKAQRLNMPYLPLTENLE